MSLSVTETYAISQLAQHLYSYLSGSAYSRVAVSLGLGDLWSGGSKQPAITAMLEAVYADSSRRFCQLVQAIVQERIRYRPPDGGPLFLEDIQELNRLLMGVGVKIPDLWDPVFHQNLPRREPLQPQTGPNPEQQAAAGVRESLIDLGNMQPQTRGFAFERLLNELFHQQGLEPRTAFRIVGEQIDGSVQVGDDTYLVEAKWRSELTNQADLLVLSGKVAGKAEWSRGLFVSYSGFAPTALEAFARGKSANLVGMTGQDLFFVLEGHMCLADAIRAKVRRAAETGDIAVSVQILASEE